MTTVNKYGLSRDIPSDVKRTVRQNSGFGCVVCGLSLYAYDHIDPPWAEAREHLPDRICLLCPNHHARKEKGLSTQAIKAAYQAPWAKRIGYSHDPEFRTCQRPLKLRLGNLVFNDPHEVLRVGGKLLLAVEDLEEEHLALSGRFYDRTGQLLLEICRNEWRCQAGNWDVERVANSLVIREKAHKLSLQVIAESDHFLTFDNIAMNYMDVGLVTNKGDPIEISYKGKPVVVHRPSEQGGKGIETKGFLDIDAAGQLRPIGGPTTIGAGSLQIGDVDQGPRTRVQETYVRSGRKVGRNEPCPCGSGRKYKDCHGKSASA
jgi:hypothetical protein